MNDEEQDRQVWEDIINSVIDAAGLTILFMAVAVICFAWGFYGW